MTNQIFTLIITLTISFSAFSQSTVSTKDLPSSSLLETISPERITYFSIFEGPALGGQDDPVDAEGVVQEDSISTWAQLSFQWKLNKLQNIVFNPRFSVNHNNSDVETFEAEDPVVGINGVWYKEGDFTFFGGINSIMPFMRTDGTKEDGQVLNPGGFNGVSYNLDSHWTVGSWLWGRARLYDRDLIEEDERFVFFVAPIVDYNFNDDYALSAFYQVNGEVRTDWDTIAEEDDHLGLLSKVTLNKYLTLQPQIQLFRKQDFNLAKGNFIVWVSGQLF